MATKKENFAEIRTILEAEGRTDLVAFVDNEVTLITKKNSYKSTKPTKKQLDNIALQEAIEKVLTSTPMTVEEIATAVSPDPANPYSTQKISANVGVLVDGGKANRSYIKRKAHFTKH